MYNSNIKTLIKKLSSIENLKEPLAKEYSNILDNINLIEDYNIDFKVTLDLPEEHFFINIKEIDEKTKNIKNYAVGANNIIQRTNKLRHDDETHHNEKPTVKKINPPHHKHEGKNETVKGFSGKIDDLVNDYNNLFNDN